MGKGGGGVEQTNHMYVQRGILQFSPLRTSLLPFQVSASHVASQHLASSQDLVSHIMRFGADTSRPEVCSRCLPQLAPAVQHTLTVTLFSPHISKPARGHGDQDSCPYGWRCPTHPIARHSQHGLERCQATTSPILSPPPTPAFPFIPISFQRLSTRQAATRRHLPSPKLGGLFPQRAVGVGMGW